MDMHYVLFDIPSAPTASREQGATRVRIDADELATYLIPAAQTAVPASDDQSKRISQPSSASSTLPPMPSLRVDAQRSNSADLSYRDWSVCLAFGVDNLLTYYC